MEESSTSMNVARVTVMATIHGLVRGPHGRSTVSWVSGACALGSSRVVAAIGSRFDCIDIAQDSEILVGGWQRQNKLNVFPSVIRSKRGPFQEFACTFPGQIKKTGSPSFTN